MTENKQQKLITKASIYIDKKQFNKAINCLHEAYVKNGKFNALVFYLLGKMYDEIGHYMDAINCLCDAIKYLNNQNNVIGKDFEYQIFWQLALTCNKTGMLEKAILFYKEAYKRSTEADRYKVLSAYIGCMISVNTSPADILEGLHKMDELLTSTRVAIPSSIHFQPKLDSNKVHIVYISPDFRKHVMYSFYYSLLKCYNKKQFYVTCIYMGDKKDEYTQKIKSMVDKFVNCSDMEFVDVVKILKSMQIDIAVDLAGFTTRSGLALFGYRIAPVQISGLGWMESTGLKETDYLITDKFMDEPGHSYITEKPLYLTSCFCYTNNDNLPVSIQAPCRKKGYVTFCSMNRITKITDEMLIVWREILNLVPDSRLLIKTTTLQYDKMQSFFHDKLKQFGYDVSRVILENGSVDYMTRYFDVDIALDTYPYTGGGTTFDALYMGVPVVSMYGERRSSRFGLSILSNAGVGELAVPTPEEYVERAVALANDWELLDILHKNLRTMLKKSPAMDAEGYVREMEYRYVQLINKNIS